MKSCVKRPDDEEFNDWLAVHVVDFFERVQILYGVVSEICTEESCPLMTGTPKYEYLWADGDKFKVNLSYVNAQWSKSTSGRLYDISCGSWREP